MPLDLPNLLPVGDSEDGQQGREEKKTKMKMGRMALILVGLALAATLLVGQESPMLNQLMTGTFPVSISIVVESKKADVSPPPPPDSDSSTAAGLALLTIEKNPCDDKYDYIEDIVSLADHNITYRVPRHLAPLNCPRNNNNNTLQQQQPPELVTGVLAAANTRIHRDRIRSSWACCGLSGTSVFYVVAGPWSEDIANEFQEQGDLIWLDFPEHYDHLLIKVKVMMAAIDKHVPSYKYILKADEDIYAKLWKIEDTVKSSKETKYVGDCTMLKVFTDPNHKWHTPPESVKRIQQETEKVRHAAGGPGYVLRRDLVKCMLQDFQHTTSVADRLEDLSIAYHALHCEAKCQGDPRFKRVSGGKRQSKDSQALTIHKTRPSDMPKLKDGNNDMHWVDCCKFDNESERMRDPTCAVRDCKSMPSTLTLPW